MTLISDEWLLLVISAPPLLMKGHKLMITLKCAKMNHPEKVTSLLLLYVCCPHKQYVGYGEGEYHSDVIL